MCRRASDTLTLSELTVEQGLERLTKEWGMMSGASVSYGTAGRSRTCSAGYAQEALYRGGSFVPAGKAITENSLYDLASLTKVFTSVAMLRLIERGKISFDDGIGQIDPRFNHLRKVSIYDTLTYQAVLRSPERIDDQPDADEAERMIFACRRIGGPEPKKLYSDMNALICKYLIESASGLRFEDYLSGHIFLPLGMNDTYAAVPDDRIGDCLNYNYEHRISGGKYLLSDIISPGLPHDPKARLLTAGRKGLCGHAGIFSSAQDMVQFAQGLLSGALLSRKMLLEIGKNRTGRTGGPYRQYLGYLCFSKSAVQHLSEVPSWMGERAFGQAGYTGNHLAIDPELGVFDLLLGNRCHMRVSAIEPENLAEDLGLSRDGVGSVPWPDGRSVRSSVRYVYQKDNLIHMPVLRRLKELGWVANTGGFKA